MIDLRKSAASEEIARLLDTARVRDNENVYRGGPVYEQIKADFHGKCYLCEDDEITAIQIDHLEPHRGDRDKKYNWRNLFFSCAHCNNQKGDRYWPLLDCTNPDHRIWQSIELAIEAFPKTRVTVAGHPGPGLESACGNTVALLDAALSGHDATPMKRDEAAVLRKKMLRTYHALTRAIANEDEDAILRAVADDAPFAGLCRWTLKRDFPTWFERLSGRFAPLRSPG